MSIRDDYLIRMFSSLCEAIARVISRGLDKTKPTDIEGLENSIAEAVNIDPDLFFNLEPESMVMMLEIGQLGDREANYVTRAMLFESKVLEAQGEMAKGKLRQNQASAIASAYNCDIPIGGASVQEIIQPFVEGVEGFKGVEGVEGDFSL